MDLLNGLADRGEWLVAGLVGAIISGWWHKAGLLDWRSWMVFLVTGVACAVFLTGIASNYLGVAEPRNITGVVFCWVRLRRVDLRCQPRFVGGGYLEVSAGADQGQAGRIAAWLSVAICGAG